MTQEEKHLLLQDLCARLPYGVKIHRALYGAVTLTERDIESFRKGFDDIIVLYLRPMESMSGDEEKEFQEMKLSYHFDEDGYILFDWLNKKMFDYRGLIEKGLALEALKEMYN